MSKFFVVAACLCALASAGQKQQKLRVIVAEPQTQASHSFGEVSLVSSGGGYDQSGFEGAYEHHDSGKGYASSAELTSLAHSSALQAKSAVQNQQTAGSQAALGAQTGFAQAALGAAATAQVALVAKRVIVQNIEHQLYDAEKQLKSEIGQYRQAQQAADAAQQAAGLADQQSSAVTAALAAVQASGQQSVQAAAQAAASAASQHSMIQQAKQRVSYITEQLHIALGELSETEAAAQKAASAAHAAQNNAAVAASAVASSEAQSQASAGTGGHHQDLSAYYH